MDNTPPLTWQARIRIAVEICSALVFLHSCKPPSIVHGDLKPANILLDENFVSKLGDFGIYRLLIQSINSTVLYHCTRQPNGTFAYMDPELLTSREITAKSDVYSFGVILLRLLTGRPALGISRVVQEALDMKCLDKIFDASAGDWPYVQAEKLAKLGLKCCEMNRRNRPDAKGAWKILEALMKSVSFVRLSTSSIRLVPEDSSGIPSYFICPIFKIDPSNLADGQSLSTNTANDSCPSCPFSGFAMRLFASRKSESEERERESEREGRPTESSFAEEVPRALRPRSIS
ncbi:hypothetical protein GW17_00046046 [Ensete ventricosum]|nr:hypothetical protein GW17_00046046 [Ensete ventricosum]